MPYGAPSRAQLAAFACVRGTQFGTPLTREPRRWPQRPRSHAPAAPSSAHSCFSWAPPKTPAAAFACVRGAQFGTPFTRFVALRELHRRPQRSHAPATHSSAHPSHGSWPLGGSTEGPSGRVRMRPRHPVRHAPRTPRGR
eukprot:4689411-Pyramimonas_sp.AAC.1